MIESFGVEDAAADAADVAALGDGAICDVTEARRDDAADAAAEDAAEAETADG